MSRPPSFLYATCQIGAERTVKAEVTGRWPDIHAAFSRPGFLTFKVPGDHPVDEDFDLHSVFARASGLSLGKVQAATDAERATEMWKLVGDRPVRRLHVWQRDLQSPGHRGFEPGITPTATAAEAAILSARDANPELSGAIAIGTADPDELVLDCVVVEPDEWWVGLHRARDMGSRWRGGIAPFELPSHAVSRAYLKMQEALAWSELPVQRGDAFVEIGCAPGGASQALLERGMSVTGIDPANVEPVVAAHPKFTHVQKRGVDVRRREFRGVRWLAIDINVAPNYTLDTVEAIVTHEAVRIEGLILTLKLLDWDLAAQLPEYLNRVRSWDYPRAKARQLSHNRQEVCVVATRSKPRG